MEPSFLPLLQWQLENPSVTRSLNKQLCCDPDLQEGAQGPAWPSPPASPAGRPLSHMPPASWSRFPRKGRCPPLPTPFPSPLGVPWGRGEAGCLSSVRLLCGEVSSPWCLLCGVHGHLPRGRVPGGWRTEVEEKTTPLDQPGGGQSAREGERPRGQAVSVGRSGGSGQGPGTGRRRRPLALRPAVWSSALHPLRMDSLV